MARRKLRRLGEIQEILVLCYGNICRSPYGEVRLRELLGNNRHTEVVSRGFFRPGRPPPPAARLVARERGLDLEGHRSRLLSREVAGRADLVLVMTPYQAKAAKREFDIPGRRVFQLGDLDPELPETRLIRDPNGRSEDFFRRVYDRIDRCLMEMVLIIGGSLDG